MKVTVDPSYIRGYMDRASHLDEERCALVASSAVPVYLNEIDKYLHTRGISSTVTKYRDGWRLRVSGVEALHIYCQVIGFSDQRLAKRVQALIRKKSA